MTDSEGKSWNDMTPEERLEVKNALLKGSKTTRKRPAVYTFLMGLSILFSLGIAGWIIYAFFSLFGFG